MLECAEMTRVSRGIEPKEISRRYRNELLITKFEF